MYDIMYFLFSCFPAALVSYKGCENFILLLFSLRFSEQPDCID
jgi:hypothetical protein